MVNREPILQRIAIFKLTRPIRKDSYLKKITIKVKKRNGLLGYFPFFLSVFLFSKYID